MVDRLSVAAPSVGTPVASAPMSRVTPFLDSDLRYAQGAYLLPGGASLGAAPNTRLWDFAQQVT